MPERASPRRTRRRPRGAGATPARQMIKRRARAYARRPRELDTVAPGLSAAAPDTLIAAGADLLRFEAAAPRRWFGFGAEAPALNARALMLLGRTLRRLAA